MPLMSMTISTSKNRALKLNTLVTSVEGEKPGPLSSGTRRLPRSDACSLSMIPLTASSAFWITS
jgi:hypothetical protein